MFRPVNAIIVKLEKPVSSSGIEISGGSKKNEGVVISKDWWMTKEMKDKLGDFSNVLVKELIVEGEEGAKIKFSESYEIDKDTVLVSLDKIVGIF
jgi:hypothetical protein